MVKRQIRVLGIDDRPFDKFHDKYTILVGTMYRGGDFIDGVISAKVKVDGENSTRKIIWLVNKSRFKKQLQAILLDGIALGGFNIIDIVKVSKETEIPVIVTMRKHPDIDKITRTLNSLGMDKKIRLLKKAGEIHKAGNIYIQFAGISLDKAKEIIKICSTHGNLPEPIRVAHIIASGITTGESKGNA